jgi:catechol 1,2-dioxygenase
MQRRLFIKNTALSAVAISAFGFVRLEDDHYVGDCETTSDILGPFYRPGSPVRNDLVVAGDNGQAVQLSGTIKHNDCITPYANAKIELWHCDPKGVYDNASQEFRYRATAFSDDKGRYSFKTILPIPYEIGNGVSRPAHFHLMITAEGYQPLITQLYFSGDKYIAKDPSAASAAAKRRILKIQKNAKGMSKVLYDVSMSPTLVAEPAALDKLTGVYTSPTDKSKILTLFKQEHALWMKNEVFGESFSYTGNNTFEYPGSPKGYEAALHFEVMPTGSVKLSFVYTDDNKVAHRDDYVKEI